MNTADVLKKCLYMCNAPMVAKNDYAKEMVNKTGI